MQRSIINLALKAAPPALALLCILQSIGANVLGESSRNDAATYSLCAGWLAGAPAASASGYCFPLLWRCVSCRQRYLLSTGPAPRAAQRLLSTCAHGRVVYRIVAYINRRNRRELLTRRRLGEEMLFWRRRAVLFWVPELSTTAIFNRGNP